MFQIRIRRQFRDLPVGVLPVQGEPKLLAELEPIALTSCVCIASPRKIDEQEPTFATSKKLRGEFQLTGTFGMNRRDATIQILRRAPTFDCRSRGSSSEDKIVLPDGDGIFSRFDHHRLPRGGEEALDSSSDFRHPE